jgi:hypothetical protein
MNKNKPVQTVNFVTPVLPRITPTLRVSQGRKTLPQPAERPIACDAD